MNPWVVILRNPKYSQHDQIFQNVNFTSKITSDINDVKLLYSEKYHVLLTIGETWLEYNIQHLMISKTFSKWIHFTLDMLTPALLNNRVMTCFIHNLPKIIQFRPEVSIFTTSFQSGNKILRPLRSLLAQKMQNFEWIIMVDGYDRLEYADQLTDPRIRIYYRHENSSFIGNVKNEAHSLCRGKYVIELDHDDEILPDCCGDTVKGFELDKDIGFIYMDFAELYENWDNYSYGSGWGYAKFGEYYRQYVVNPSGGGQWLHAAISCPINNLTLRDICSIPNHPRIWRKSVLDAIGGYSESMAVTDDYQVFLRTFFATKILRIPKLAYLQYKNAGGSNYSLIRHGEIRKIQDWISQFYRADIDKYFENLPKANSNESIWKLDEYVDTKVNLVHNFNYDTTILVKNIESLSSQALINHLKNDRTDIILVLSFDFKTTEILTQMGLNKIKFQILPNATDKQIDNYFIRCYLSTKDFLII